MAGDFKTELNLTYQFGGQGEATITYSIAITNLNTNKYADSYKLFLDGFEPVDVETHEDGHEIKSALLEEDGGNYLNITFARPVVGVGETRKFDVVFKNGKLAQKTGDIWEITIPRLINTEVFDDYSLNVKVPESFGQLAYVSPKFLSSTAGINQIFTFSKKDLRESAVSMGFGKFQVFSFDLTYHLENPLPRESDVDVAIPMDTSYQRMIYKNISPLPKSLTIDSDGNWIATIALKPRERVDLKTSGWVQIFAAPRKLSIETTDQTQYIKDSEFWPVTDAYIKSLGKRLGSTRSIYDYVTSNFTYDYSRTTVNVQRIGAKAALTNPKSAICTEFTDSFIALARTIGIPAREVNGYAYASNPQTEPLSLVADVLHSWAMYWDSKNGVWVQVDPTWGATSATDYFTKLDLRHFAFVIHGVNDSKPYPAGSYKLGPNPQKDVFVGISELPSSREGNIKVDFVVKRQIPFFDMRLTAKITNNGSAALYNQKVLVSFDNKVVREVKIPYILPFGTRNEEVTVPYSFLGSNDMPEKVSLTTQNGDSYAITTYKMSVIATNLAASLILIFILILCIYLLIKKSVKKTK